MTRRELTVRLIRLWGMLLSLTILVPACILAIRAQEPPGDQLGEYVLFLFLCMWAWVLIGGIALSLEWDYEYRHWKWDHS